MRARKVDVDTVVQLYNAGDAPSTIALRLHIGRSTVSQTLREAGVEMRRPWRGPGASHLADDLAWMDEDRLVAPALREGGCCTAFRAGVVAALVGNPDVCVRCAAQQRAVRR